jgi:two-component system chemotaxis response regulator CheB
MTLRFSVATRSSFLSMVIHKGLVDARHLQCLSDDRDPTQALKTLADNPDLAIVDADLLTDDQSGEALVDALVRRSRPAIVIDARAHGVTDRLKRKDSISLLQGKTAGELDLGAVESGLRTLVDQARRKLGESRESHPNLDARVNSRPTISPSGLEIAVIGVSTGGPTLLLQLVSALRKPAIPLIIVQHMPESHTQGYAARLAEECGHRVIELGPGPLPREGFIGVLRGGQDYELARRPGGALALRKAELAGNPFHPNIDAVLLSALAAGISLGAAILTGMGQDGTEGAVEMTKRGLPVVAQQPETCAVAGMPQSVINRGAASMVCSPDGLTSVLNLWCSGGTNPEGV